MTLERMQLSVAPGDGLVARFGDLIVVTPTDVNAAWQQVNEFKPASVRGAGRIPLVAAE